MATSEHSINDALASILRSTRHSWRRDDVIRSENTGVLKDVGKRPDILIDEAAVSPVVVEAEFEPANTVDEDALSRVGAKLRQTGEIIHSAIALRYPQNYKSTSTNHLQRVLEKEERLAFALFTGEDCVNAQRLPAKGWMKGSVRQLSILIQRASIPQVVVERATHDLISGVREAAGLFTKISEHHRGAVRKICESLMQEDDDQTRKMAMTILVNALVFHASFAATSQELAEVLSFNELRDGSKLNKTGFLREWQKILEINYWPVFHVAREILGHLPDAHATEIIGPLSKTAEELVSKRLMRSHDLTGEVFQKLIADRKFLAAFYTTPASAALLVGLSVTEGLLKNPADWKNPDTVKAIRVADFACGTGTLLTTLYQRIGQLHELAGGNSEDLHNDMMAQSLIGCDILPAATHITASMLASAHPSRVFTGCSVFTIPYGRRQDNECVVVGSLELLTNQGELDLDPVPITSKAMHGRGETETNLWKDLPSLQLDLVIMNPPFVRPTNHEGLSENVPNPMFAAFGSSPKDQADMSARLQELTKGHAAHGNAGEASHFLALGHHKLKKAGTLALVMPLSLVTGTAWERTRQLLATQYRDLIVVSISGAKDKVMSFSADTGMGECLIVGKKGRPKKKRATFVVLSSAPAQTLEGASIADQVLRMRRDHQIRSLDGGPFDGTPICFGEDIIGEMVEADLPKVGGWNVARIADMSLAQCAYQLVNRQLIWLPAMRSGDAVPISICTVSNLATIGPIHRDINGINQPAGTYRGPFDLHPISKERAPTFPVLWAHDASREEYFCFGPDKEGYPRQSDDPQLNEELRRKAEAVWKTASHAHFNLDFRYNSQPAGMQFTPEKTIGGRAWLSVQLTNIDQEKALVLWSNTTLGMLVHWWQSNKQQSGRGSITKTTLASFRTLDVRTLSEEQLSIVTEIFDDLKTKPLFPPNRIEEDSTRHEIDRRFLGDVLGMPASVFGADCPVNLLRKKLANEPSIHGHKGKRKKEKSIVDQITEG